MVDAEVAGKTRRYNIVLTIMAKQQGKSIDEVSKSVEKAGGRVTKNMGQYKKEAIKLNTEIQGTKDAIKSGLIKPMQRFRMEMLGVMFFGMALKRFFESFLKAMWQTYTAVTEGQDAMSKSMLRVNAAWEFFKFAVMSALEPFVILLGEMVVGLLDFVSANPKLTKMIGIFTMLGSVIATVLFVVGTMVLGLTSLAGAIPTVMAVVFAIIAIGLAIIGVMSIMNSLTRLHNQNIGKMEYLDDYIVQVFFLCLYFPRYSRP